MSLDPHSALEFLIEVAEREGADFAEARHEEMHSLFMRFEKDNLQRVSREVDAGIGITVYLSGARGYSYTTELTEDSLKRAVKEAIKVAKASVPLAKFKAPPVEYKLKEYSGLVPTIRKYPSQVPFEEKLELVLSGIKEALKKDVVSLTTYYGEKWGKKLFLNSEGLKREWAPIKVGVLFSVVVKKDGNLGRSYEDLAASRGLEIFDERSPEDVALTAVKGAEDNAIGRKIESGEYPLVADPRFAGLIAHESFGHLTEGDYVATKASILFGRLGEKLGSEHANVIDSGDPVNYGYWVPYDDEGVDARTVYLVKNGVLTSYLQSRATAKALNAEPTGNARAISFRFPPIVRMRNTYFGSGDMSKEEVFELIGKGVYAEGSMGGQTNDVGVFTFTANRAYWVEDGEIKYPLKQVTVRGNVLDFLKNIIGASKEVVVRTSVLGGCGKGGQAPLPVGLGGPYLAVSKAIISSG